MLKAKALDSSDMLPGDFEDSPDEPAVDPELAESSRQLREWASRPRRQRAKTIPGAPWERACAEADAMMASGDWSGAAPRHFAALYGMLHATVYGVECAELGPKERFVAAGLAARMLDSQFGGDAGAMAAFMRWTWQRELDREKRRRASGEGGGRIGYRLQFNGAVLTDYRLDLARRKSR